MTPKLAATAALVAVIAWSIAWFSVFTVSFLLDVVPHGGAW